MRDDDALAGGPTALATDPDGTAPASDERLAPGDRAGEYAIVEHLGAGAMGDVYAGTHPVVDKRVAVKVIKRRLASSAEAVERFVREAKAVNRVDHPSVLDVFSFGRLDDGRLYLVMDLLSGESLGDRIRRDGAMSIDEALAILEPVCAALHAAHTRDVVHRDLKPDNVFVTDAGDVYVLDFGIAKMLTDVAAEAGVQTLTGEGVWLGTPAYMAPEQWTSDGASASSDIYALGAMCFEMLTGRPPYRARSVPAMMEQHFHADIPLVTTSAGVSVPAAIDDVIARAMAKAPEDRFETPAALLEALRAARADTATAAGPRSAPIDPTPARPPHRAVYAAGGAVLVAGVAVVALLASRGGAERADDTPRPTPRISSAEVSVDIRSTPDGARIYRDGRYLGMTPSALTAIDGTELELRLTKPGYGEVSRSIVAAEGAALDATLPAVEGFEGQWELPDGSFRSFERRGDRVVGYRHATAAAEPEFLRFFEFAPADGPMVSFGAASEHVDERAPNEPSCRLSLRAEYRYTPATDALELREERIGYDFKDGRCVVYAKEWAPFEPVTRLTSSFEGPTRWATSTAGAGNVGAPPEAAEQPNREPERKAAPNAPVTEKKKRPTTNKQAPEIGLNDVLGDTANVGAQNAEPPTDDQAAGAPEEPAQRETNARQKK